MSFLVKQPTLPQGAGAADPKLNSGYKAADVVPMGWGRDIFPSKWISNKYDEHTQRAGENKPDWQYCSIAAGYTTGPIDYVGKVFSNGKEIANFDYTFSVGEESHTFTLNPALASGRAWQVIVHRGALDANTSTVADLRTKTGQTHPPYRGYAWAEWLNIDLGGGTTALPSLALELGTYAPAIGDFPGSGSHPYGVNPIGAVYALCMAAQGGDFDASLLDAGHWGDQALALESIGVSGRTGTLVHCHPTFTASTSLADAISQILAYVDGYIYAGNGELRVGWFPSAAVDGSTLPEITEADLEAKPSGGGFPDWNEGATSVVVSFKSFARNYGDDAARYNAPANRENNVTADPVRRERPWVHAADQAAMMAAEGATESSGGEISTNLTVLKSRAVDGTALLIPGDLVNWDYGPHSLDLVCRVTARRLRMGLASDVLTLTRERGAYPRPYVAPIDDRVDPADDDPGEINTADVRLYLLPSGIASTRQIAPIVDRTKRTIYRVDLHMSTAGSAPWEKILESRFFAAKGAVNNAGINNSVTTVRIGSTSVDFARMTAQNAVGVADDTLLLLIDDELMSVGAIASVSSGVYDLTITRGRRGTTAAAHSLAAVSWLFFRSEIDSVEHAEFYRVRDGSNVYDATIATKYFKLQLFTIGIDGLAKPDDPGISKTLPDLTASDLQGYTIILTNEAHTVACDSAGTASAGQLGAGSPAFTDVVVIRGSTPLTAVASGPNSDQFSIALGTLTNTTATKVDADTVRCDTLTADTGTIAITVSVAGAFTLTKTFSLTKAKNGATGGTGAAGTRGSKHFYAATTGTSWSNTEADAAIVADGLTKVLLDVVTLYKTSAGYSETRFWDGAAWVVVTQVIDGNLLVNGTIGATKLAVTTLSAITANMGSITAGTIDLGSGIDRVLLDGAGLRYGNASGANAAMDALSATAAGFFLRSTTTNKASWVYDSFSSTVELLLGTNDKFQCGSIVIENSFIQFGNSTNLYSDGTSLLRTDDTFRCAAFISPYFETGVAPATDVKDGNLRVFSGATQTARIDYTNGDYYNQLSKVLSSRETGWALCTGTATKGGIDTATATLPQVAQVVKALVDVFYSHHGSIGA